MQALILSNVRVVQRGFYRVNTISIKVSTVSSANTEKKKVKIHMKPQKTSNAQNIL